MPVVWCGGSVNVQYMLYSQKQTVFESPSLKDAFLPHIDSDAREPLAGLQSCHCLRQRAQVQSVSPHACMRFRYCEWRAELMRPIGLQALPCAPLRHTCMQVRHVLTGARMACAMRGLHVVRLRAQANVRVALPLLPTNVRGTNVWDQQALQKGDYLYYRISRHFKKAQTSVRRCSMHSVLAMGTANRAMAHGMGMHTCNDKACAAVEPT